MFDLPPPRHISTLRNLAVRHPLLVSDRILRYAAIVGRENVIAGTDCGLGGRVHAPTECVRGLGWRCHTLAAKR